MAPLDQNAQRTVDAPCAKLQVGLAGAANQVVGEDLVVELVRDPHGDAIGPEAHGSGVAGGVQGVDVLGRAAGAAGQVVCEDLFAGQVRDPHGDAIGPDSRGVVVACAAQGVDVLGGVAGAVGEVVGVDLAVVDVGDPTW